MSEYIEREALIAALKPVTEDWTCPLHIAAEIAQTIEQATAADVVEVASGYHAGDVCIYGFGHKNKSKSLVEIVRILDDVRGVAEVKFHKVFVDVSFNGWFNYLLKSGNTMNASFKYLKNITPRKEEE